MYVLQILSHKNEIYTYFVRFKHSCIELSDFLIRYFTFQFSKNDLDKYLVVLFKNKIYR